MWRHLSIVLSLLITSSVVALLQPVLPATAEPITIPALERTWARTDRPVAEQVVSRTWMWGPEPFTGLVREVYEESPSGVRRVQYFDKSRMEITDPDAPDAGLWYVTNGLLSKELMTGDLQIGDDEFVHRDPAQVNVAGDDTDPNGPTYWTFGTLMDDPPLAAGTTITHTVDRFGTVMDGGALGDLLAEYGVWAVGVGSPTGRQVASVFWDFMNATGTVHEGGQYVEDQLFVNPFYATGYPLTDAYWTIVRLQGVGTRVLIQCFERRCLTYTPSNPAGWRVEAGNVGRHYYEWRYDTQEELAGGVVATFDVNGETFRIWVTNPDTIEQLEALRDGVGSATIPSGPVRYGAGQGNHNAPWSWHIDPEDVVLTEVVIELCDGLPSWVEANVEEFVEVVGGYCPWGAELVDLANYRGLEPLSAGEWHQRFTVASTLRQASARTANPLALTYPKAKCNR